MGSSTTTDFMAASGFTAGADSVATRVAVLAMGADLVRVVAMGAVVPVAAVLAATVAVAAVAAAMAAGEFTERP
jgi:hypothetical protein